MSIPPFPSQDLAKLVLGYLAEEQLMTAYDEFLQASPYLDALKNEYDRIFMTSLKTILAEYRAVKIYVDTCKPFVLRKRIFQCSNLLDVVKFLVTNVDIHKIQLLDATEKVSLEKQKTIITTKQNSCELCHSLTLPHCVCKSRQADVQQPESVCASNVEASSLQTSIETTPLADLPGNHVTMRKKNVKMLEKDCTPLNSNTSSVQNTDSDAKQSFSSHISPEEYLARCESSPVLKSSDNSYLSLNSTVKAIDSSKSNQNIEEFNDVLKSVVNRNKTLSSSECPPNQRISNASTFQDFASGVSSGEIQNATYNVPDSSTSEHTSNVKAPVRKDVYNDNIKGPPQCQLMLQVSHVNDNIKIETCREEISKPKSVKIPKIQPKPVEKKIQIISDVKVGNKYSDKSIDNIRKKTIVQRNATSTPLMQLQMQTIMINGTPAYKHTPKTHSYTEDEIMAMPTLIVVPASGSSQISTSAHCEPIMTQSCSIMSKESSSPRVLGPLVIDVPPNIPAANKPVVTELPDLDVQKAVDSGLVKTVDVIKSNNSAMTTTSVPKDNITSMESNTPLVLPPTRKSSSTPRRSSHVRVLDFTTPRRILHETINEQVPSQSSDPPVENVLSGSLNVVNTETPETVDIKSEIVVVVNEEGNTNDGGSTKENESANKIINQTKTYDWDADLRALVANEKTVTVSHRKPKTKTSKKKKASDKDIVKDKPEFKKRTRSKKSPKIKKTKINRNIEELDEEPSPNQCNTNDIPCKLNINIICGKNHEKIERRRSKDDIESTKNKSNDKADEYIDTPEAERLSLQNVIGAKLNISDLLETPYKQALYDIQMETPRFLGTDLPDEPLSDIKIMNIPTPRFLNTSKPAQATPSSYSSRPTDYSSGGSYYKPDDQDYLPIPDLMICPATSSKEDVSGEKSEEKDSEEKKSRPVRQCTKNVSYYKSSTAVNKTKDIDDIADSASLCSESISINSSFEFKEKDSSLPKNSANKSQSLSRPESKKRNSSCRKRKSPKDSVLKDKTKSFMKIKPRYTPKKDTPSVRNRKKAIPSPHSKGSPYSPQRKRTSSKEKLVSATTMIVPLQTKSRRKSSTPRKLKNFNPDSYGHTSPENILNIKPNVNREKMINNPQDSDTEQLALRWSDDGSQDTKAKDVQTNTIANEIEDITKIKMFLDSSDENKHIPKTDSPEQANIINAHTGMVNDGNLQRDLMRRGFDLETAKIIERDLLDDTPLHSESTKCRMLPISIEIVENKKEESLLEKTSETDSSIKNALQIVQDETDNDEIELSVHECYEESPNYFVFEHDDTKAISRGPPIKLKDNFTMEICIDDVTMRLRATPFILANLDQEPLPVDEIDYSYKETEQAVSSISNMDRLYTPLKDSIKAQCYEIFDSTLTSIDTPLKANSPIKKASKASVSELVLENETDAKEKSDAKKRKRVRSGSNEPANINKRTRQDADLLLKTANIQNIDIETVLTKLHGH